MGNNAKVPFTPNAGYLSKHLYKKEYRKQIDLNHTWSPPSRPQSPKLPSRSPPPTSLCNKSYHITSLTRRTDLYMLDDSQAERCDMLTANDSDNDVISTLTSDQTSPSIGFDVIKTPQPRLHRRKQIRPPYVKYVENKKNKNLARQLPLLQEGPRTDIWTYSYVGDDHSQPLYLPLLADCGNMSFSVMSKEVWLQLQSLTKHDWPLQPYPRAIRGVGGHQVNVLGKSVDQLTIVIPGLTQPQYCHFVVIDSPGHHINLALKSLKDGSLSLHFFPNRNTVLECRQSQSSVQLSNRGELMPHPNAPHKVEEICHLIDTYRQSLKDLSAAQLMELNRLQQVLPSLLNPKQVILDTACETRVCDDLIQAACESLELASSGSNSSKEVRSKCVESLKHYRPRLQVNQEQIAFPTKSFTIPSRTHMYIQFNSNFNLGQEYYCESNLPQFAIKNIAVIKHLGKVHCKKGTIQVPITNITDQSISIQTTDPIVWLHGLSPQWDTPSLKQL